MPDTPGLLLVISGPSGVGKSTIAHALEGRLGAKFSVSMTTRPKAPKEVEGRDYYFVDEARFHRALEQDELLEHAKVFDHMYGTPRKPIEAAIEAGDIVVLEIDIEGAVQVKAQFADAFSLFILPPKDEELLRRLRDRGREGEAIINRRFSEQQREVKRAKETGVYDQFVVNDDLEQTIDKVVDLIEARRTRESTG